MKRRIVVALIMVVALRRDRPGGLHRRLARAEDGDKPRILRRREARVRDGRLDLGTVGDEQRPSVFRGTPRFKVGCGGIDLFMGGFSFLNVNYLVQKFQKILQAAPAMAFDLALSTLCQQCSNIMKSLEALANELNGLQMNDCHDAKVLSAKLVSPFTDNPKIKAEAQQDFSLETGLTDIYNDIQQAVKSNWRAAHDIERDAHVQRLSLRDNQPVHDPGAKRLLRRGRRQGDTVEPRGAREGLYRRHPVRSRHRRVGEQYLHDDAR